MRLDTAQVGTFAYAYDRENRLMTRAMAFPLSSSVESKSWE
jgi:hypothetical protein